MKNYFIENSLNKFLDISDIKNLMTPRIQLMKDVVQELNDAGLRKTLMYDNIAESLKTTQGEPQNIRRAKALVHHLKNIDTPVFKGEQIIGSIVGMWPVDEERNPTYEELFEETTKVLDAYFADRGDASPINEDQLVVSEGGLSFEEKVAFGNFRFGSLMARDHFDANIDYQDMQKLIKDMNAMYADVPGLGAGEIGAVIEKHFLYDYGEETQNLLNENGWNAANHTNLNYKKLVTCGIGDIIEEIELRFKKAVEQEKKDFYESCAIVMRGVVDYIKRYAQATAVAANEETDPARKAELSKMASVIDKIATETPSTLIEAVQFVWMIHLVGNLFGGSALSLGRMDQYLLPFYKNDIENGTISIDRVRELLCSLYLKLNEPKMRTVQSLCVGGVNTQNGEDATNDLTKLCLEVMSLLKLPYPNMSVRIATDKSPDWLYDEVVRTVKAGCGQPMLLNDDVWIPNLESLGMPIEWARDYYNMGCTEIMIQGKDSNWVASGFMMMPGILMRQMKRYKDGDAKITDFDAFLEEYLNMIAEDMSNIGKFGLSIVNAQRERNCDPFASSLIDGCLENGTDYFKGGSDGGDPLSITGQGFGTVADSIAVIKKYVFEEKSITISELYDMCIDNFKGNELFRQRISNSTPAYGNDEEYVDEIAKKVFDKYSYEVRKLNEIAPPKARFVNNVFSYNLHIAMGEMLGATPNGRKAGEAISDCAGPTQGKDVSGPTAFLNSTLKLSADDVTGAHALNFKISPSLVKDEQGTQALIRLLKVYLEERGPQIQINYVSIEDLKSAQKEPDKHRDLVVRIAGYCEYFVNLDYKLQNEIMERTLHEIS